MLKRLGFSLVAPLVALMMTCAPQAQAKVHFGVYVGPPVYPPPAYYPYVSPYPYPDEYAYPPPAYGYTYWGWHHDRGHWDHHNYRGHEYRGHNRDHRR